MKCWQSEATSMEKSFPDVPDDEYLSRREQIKEKKKRKASQNAPEEDAPSSKRGRGRGGQGRGRGRGRGVLKRPAARAVKATQKPPKHANDAEDEEEEEEEEGKMEQDQMIEPEGQGTASSSGPPENPGLGQNAAAPLPGPAQPKAKARVKARSGANQWQDDVTSTNPNWPWHAEVRSKIKAHLHECSMANELDSKTKHMHCSVEQPEEHESLSVYWSRTAVGVKVRNGLADKWAQCAYFARPSPCPMTNVVIATEWARV